MMTLHDQPTGITTYRAILAAPSSKINTIFGIKHFKNSNAADCVIYYIDIKDKRRIEMK